MARLDPDALQALMIAYTYMPKAIEVNEFDFAGRVEKTLAHIEAVREVLLVNDIDPDEVHGDINPEDTPNSSY